VGDAFALLLRGKANDPQLLLPLEDDGIHGATVRALRNLVKWEGLRHWTALLRLLSVEGGRKGWVRWTMAGHLDAVGYSAREHRNPAMLARVARQVELLTTLELALYDRNGRERHRAPLFHVTGKHDRLEGSAWRLDGMELRINPRLYDGVRDEATGELGSNWFPAPVELARVDHVRHPHALPLGLLLPMRWRWALGEGEDHLTLAGHNLLELAGIGWREKHPGAAWAKLDRDLAELRRIGLLDRWTWNDGEPSRAGKCRLWPGVALVDRAARGVLPVERPAVELPATGAELRAWREARAWSQSELARRIEVNQATVSRAEARGGAALPARLREALALA
jgi:DNA-binding XRE family transcriptional regulator